MSALLATGMIGTALGDLDARVLHWVTCRLYAPWLDPILLQAQEKRIAIPFALVAILLIASRSPRRAFRVAFSGALGFGLAMLIATILWATLDRPRPPAVYREHLTTKAEQAACASRPDALPLRKSASTSPSFPSRHALTAGVLAAVFLLASRPLGVLAVLYGLLTIVGRVYGAKHWPSDVLAGFGLGLLLGSVAWHLTPRLLERLPFGRGLLEEAARGREDAKPLGPPTSSAKGRTGS